MEPYTRQLERLCINRGVALPSQPPASWAVPGEELFVPKLKPYPSLSPESEEEGASEGGNGGGDGEGDDSLYEVERIINKRMGDDGQLWYRVKWKHCSSSHNEWIPQRNVLHCAELIDEFEATEAAAKGARGGGTKGTKTSHAAAAAAANKRK